MIIVTEFSGFFCGTVGQFIIALEYGVVFSLVCSFCNLEIFSFSEDLNMNLKFVFLLNVLIALKHKLPVEKSLLNYHLTGV